MIIENLMETVEMLNDTVDVLICCCLRMIE